MTRRSSRISGGLKERRTSRNAPHTAVRYVGGGASGVVNIVRLIVIMVGVVVVMIVMVVVIVVMDICD